MSDLFQLRDVVLHSGGRSRYIIDCNALSDDSVKCLAFMLAERLPKFGRVEGVPRGGLRLALALQDYALHTDEFPLLIVDDVNTTGNSLEKHRAGRDAIGAVIYARGPRPAWVTALFELAPVPHPFGIDTSRPFICKGCGGFFPGAGMHDAGFCGQCGAKRLVTHSNELIRFAGPAAEAMLRADAEASKTQEQK